MFNQIVNFRIEVEAYPSYSNLEFFLECDLMFSEMSKIHKMSEKQRIKIS